MNKEEYLRQKKEFEEYKNKISGAYVDSWLENLKEHTFATDMIQIKLKEANLLIKAHEEYEKTKKVTIPDGLNDLKDKVGKSIAKFGKAFVKTSSRSPKDVVSGRMEKIFYTLLDKCPVESQNDNNLRYSFLATAATHALLATSAEEVFDLLIRSNRVYEDIIEAQEFGNDIFSFSIVIREWYEPISIDLEFRCFYSEGRLTAITQYNYLCFYSHVLKTKDEIQSRIVDFVAKLKLPDTCIIDLFVGDEIKVIELNAFEDATGTLLFDWKKDREILTHGPLEFRVTLKPLESFAFIQSEYKKFFV